MSSFSDLTEILLQGQANSAIANLKVLQSYDQKKLKEISDVYHDIQTILYTSKQETPTFLNGVLVQNYYDLLELIKILYRTASSNLQNTIDSYDRQMESNKDMVENNKTFMKLIECTDPEKLKSICSPKETFVLDKEKGTVKKII